MGEQWALDTIVLEEYDTLATLEEKMESAPVLYVSRTKGHLTLDTDAFD